MNVVRGDATLTQALSAIARSTPLFFLAVSVYFENRIEFYDLVIKRGVLLIITLLLIGIAFTAALGTLDTLPPTPARPWLFAVLLLPVAMILPWLHDRTARLLDRLWFGRELTPADAVWRVLAAMQQATDEASLVASTTKALSDIFQRPVNLLLDDGAVPGDAALLLDIARPSGATPFRVAVGRGSSGRALLSEDVALLRSLVSVFGHMLENIRLQRRRQEQEQLAQQLRLQSSRSELKALRAQINPHFLFNALNAIASLIHTDPARADRAVEQLAEMFRHTLRRSEQDWAPLQQELAFARAYLEIEQARFGPRLEFSIDSDERLQRAYVPSMLLQTLVENAVKHGIARLHTPGSIDVRAQLHGARVVLEVRDTGPGFDPPAPVVGSGEGFGLRSVRDRLRGHFGDGAALHLERARDATVARIDLPLVEVLAPAPEGAPDVTRALDRRAGARTRGIDD
jgi:signal transduction histidine kinase